MNVENDNDKKIAAFLSEPSVSLYLDALPNILFFQDLILTALDFNLRKNEFSNNLGMSYLDKIITQCTQQCNDRKLTFGANAKSVNDLVGELKQNSTCVINAVIASLFETIVVEKSDEQ